MNDACTQTCMSSCTYACVLYTYSHVITSSLPLLDRNLMKKSEVSSVQPFLLGTGGEIFSIVLQKPMLSFLMMASVQINKQQYHPLLNTQWLDIDRTLQTEEGGWVSLRGCNTDLWHIIIIVSEVNYMQMLERKQSVDLRAGSSSTL